ncbi:MAG: type II toxin-antitoxin system PemK/MazF family toxin [Deltaproteobacteria bacterium]|nr:type II toxin-antitoxin system PemK/MazF family toxin [Deltaproteobacteria bacterium]
MKVKQFEIWLADLNPQIGTEPGKTRPVLIVQSNLLNRALHPSSLICPLTTNIKLQSEILRLHIELEGSGLKEKSDVMIDQVRAIDNQRLTRKIGRLPEGLIDKLKENLMIVFDFD